MDAHGNGWVNWRANFRPRRQFEDGEAEDEDDMDDEVYEGA